MLTEFGDRMVDLGSGTEPPDYYAILDEFMWMNRVHWRSFKQLRDWAIEKAGAKDYETPARMVVPRRRTGFVVFPVPDGEYDNRLTALQNYTRAAKYDLELDHQIGVVISRIEGNVEIDWMVASFPWRPDPEMDERLKDNYPFRDELPARTDFRYRQSHP
jgi:hypothetical protein